MIKVQDTVRITSFECCQGFKEGTIGVVKQITPGRNGGCIKVTTADDFWYHCPKCLEVIKDEQ